jgi:hypothetical protein
MTRKRLGAILVMVGLILLALQVVPFGSEFLEVDGCLDSGGSFDYSAMRCDHQTSHPYRPYSSRHPALAFGAAMALIGFAVLGSAIQRSRISN